MKPAGMSGASIRVLGPWVLKYGSDKVGHQAFYQSAYLAEVSPRVYLAGKTWFLMEKLEPVSLPDEHSVATARRIKYVLERDVWPKDRADGYRSFSKEALVSKVRSLSPQIPDYYKLIDPVLDLVYLEYSKRGKAVRTHGDPTIENAAWSSNNDLKLLDPIHPEAWSPGIKHVDLAKILQSMVGFELIKYQKSGLTALHPNAALDELMILSPPDRVLTLFFCALHFSRAIPYAPSYMHTPMYLKVKSILEILLNDYFRS
jgi:hypothetical protein